MKTEKSNNINTKESITTHPASEASQSGSISSMQAMERKLQKADRKQASLYLFCNFISLMLISAYSAMMFSPTVLNILPEGGDSRKQMYAIFALSLFGCVVFTIYAASLFFRKKSRQLGILMALGASRKRLTPGLFGEVFTLSASSSILGIIAGFPFVWLLWNGFRLFLVDSEEMALHFDFRCLLVSILFLLIVIAFSCLTAWRYLKKTNIIDVVQEEHKNEPVRELGSWCGPAGIIILFAGTIIGYGAPGAYMNIFSAYPPEWINLLYAPVFVGLYMIMLHTVVHGWGRRKKHPYKNIIARSMMKFQGRQTVNNLLVSTVLIAGGCFGIFYIPIFSTASILETSSRDYDYFFYSRADQDVPDRSVIEQLASGYDLNLTDWQEHAYISLGVDGQTRVEEGRSFHYEYMPLLSECKVMSEETYNQISGDDIDVLPGTCYGTTSTSQKDSFWINSGVTKFTNMCTMESFDTHFEGFLQYDLIAGESSSFYVVDNADFAALSQDLTDDWKGNMLLFNADGEDNYEFARQLYLNFVHSFDSECEIISSYDRVQKYVDEQNGQVYWGDTDEMTKISYDKPDSTDFRMYWSYMPKIRIMDQNEFLQSFAVFLMMFLFIAIICFTAALIICYTRCQTIALNNRYVFDDLRRLGASPKFLAQEVKNQCGKVFTVPSIVGMTVMFLLYIMIMYANDGTLTSPEIVGLGVCFCVLLMISIFIYGVYFKTIHKIQRQLGIC